MRPLILAIALAAAGAAPALVRAQEAKPACAKVDDTALPADLAAWTDKAPIVSAGRAADLSKATLTAGRAVMASLHPTRQVAYVTQPEKPGGSVASGGLFAVDIAQPGTYRVVLGSGAWIDLLSKGKAVESSAHTPGPPCSSARKIVDFPLSPGAYVLQISANADPTIGILITPRP